MSVVYSNAVKDARMLAVRDEIDGGGGAGKLEIGTAGMASVLATFPLEAVCGTVSGFPKTDPADATGTAAAARIRDFADADIITGLTVGTSGTDIVLDSVAISSGQDVTINSAVVTHA